MSTSPDIESNSIPAVSTDYGSVDNREQPQTEEGSTHSWMEDTRISAILMWLTYASVVPGLGLGISELTKDEPNLDVATILAVAVGGILSFLRHSVFHRSDEKRIGWIAGGGTNSEGTRIANMFLIEVGMANLSWGLLGLLSVVCQWGTAVQAASFLVFGIYIAQVAVLLVALKVTKHPQALEIGPMIAMTSFAALLLYVGTRGMQLAMAAP